LITNSQIKDIVSILQDAQGTDYNEEMIEGIRQAIDILENKSNIQPSVIDQLQTISNCVFKLFLYSKDVDGDDDADTKLYSELFDMIETKLGEIE